jgi:hypothetical protein
MAKGNGAKGFSKVGGNQTGTAPIIASRHSTVLNAAQNMAGAA